MTKEASTLLFEKNRVTLGPPPIGKWYAALCQSGAGMAAVSYTHLTLPTKA